MKLNRSKCQFGLNEITVPGHVITAEGIKPHPKKTEAIRQALPPKNFAELRSFLGTGGYVSKFIQDYTNIVEPLRKLTSKEAKWGTHDLLLMAEVFLAKVEIVLGGPL